MKYKPSSGVLVITDALCCKPTAAGEESCMAVATWELTFGATVDDISHSCDAHVVDVLDGKPMLSAVPIWAKERKPDHLDIVFDGPPGPVSGRFVEVEASYATFAPKGVDVGEWIDDGHFWRLRIPVFGVYG